MEPLIREDLEDEIVRLSLCTGPGNPLSPDLLAAFDGHLTDLESDPPRAMVLDGGTGQLFSGGFDLNTILTFSRREMMAFFRHFVETMARLIELPAPTLAAIHGHAVAGGFILPLACDFRIVDSGPLKLGLGGVDLGLVVPAGAQILLAARTSPAASLRLSLFGGLISPDEAADLGYADVLSADSQFEALNLARTLATKPGQGVRNSKILIARPLAEQVRLADRRGMKTFIDTWFSEEAQHRLQSLGQTH